MASTAPLDAAHAAPVPFGRALLRGLLLLLRAAPLALPVSLLQSVLSGLAPAPAAVAVAGGNLVTNATRAAHWGAAGRAVLVNAAILGLALAVIKVGRGLSSSLHAVLGYQGEAALLRVRVQAAVSFPGLAPLDDPAIADQLAAGNLARSARFLVGDVQTIMWYGVTLLACAVIAGRMAWWAPLGIIAASLPGTWHGWRQAQDVGLLTSTAVPELRQAEYARDLAVNLEPARELRLFGLGDWLVERQQRRWAAALLPVFAKLNRQLRNDLGLSALKAVVAIATFVVVGVLISSTRLGVGQLTTGVLALTEVAGMVGYVETFLGGLRADSAFLPNLFALADEPARDPRLEVRGDRTPPTAPTRGIAFEGVTFAYPGTARPILEDFDLLLPAGGSMALVGENGAGKSTVVKLLARLYDPDGGRITWDGTDIREWDLAEYRRRLAVATLPEHYGTQLGKDLPEGHDLSGGQWQKIAVSRGLMRDRPLLVLLDEPTAALDPRAEHELFERYRRLADEAREWGGVTVLVSHRFSTVQMADLIAVLDGGRLIEVGSHDTLLAAGGHYAELYCLQASRYA